MYLCMNICLCIHINVMCVYTCACCVCVSLYDKYFWGGGMLNWPSPFLPPIPPLIFLSPSTPQPIFRRFLGKKCPHLPCLPLPLSPPSLTIAKNHRFRKRIYVCVFFPWFLTGVYKIYIFDIYICVCV